MAVSTWALFTVTLVAETPPRETVVSGVNPEPKTVIKVPPAKGPITGTTELTVGASAV